MLIVSFQVNAENESSDADMALFEFLALFDQKDADYIDEEIVTEQGLVKNNVTKGETNE